MSFRLVLLDESNTNEANYTHFLLPLLQVQKHKVIVGKTALSEC